MLDAARLAFDLHPTKGDEEIRFRVGMFRQEIAGLDDLYGQLFAQLAAGSSQVIFTGLELAAGKLP